MGTYTTNYNLFLPSIGEQGWGTLVNGNFTTIDTTMGNLNTRLTAVENEVNGNLSCTSVATSGTITSTGKITANGGIGTTSLTTSSTITSTGKITANGGIAGGAISGTTGTFSGTLKANFITFSDGVITVSPSSTYINIIGEYLAILPPTPLGRYTGSIVVKCTGTSSGTTYTFRYFRLGTDSASQTWSKYGGGGSTTISFTNIIALYCSGGQYMPISVPTFS